MCVIIGEVAVRYDGWWTCLEYVCVCGIVACAGILYGWRDVINVQSYTSLVLNNVSVQGLVIGVHRIVKHITLNLIRAPLWQYSKLCIYLNVVILKNLKLKI